eukprot:1530518-Rhodomonas_salina.1
MSATFSPKVKAPFTFCTPPSPNLKPPPPKKKEKKEEKATSSVRSRASVCVGQPGAVCRCTGGTETGLVLEGGVEGLDTPCAPSLGRCAGVHKPIQQVCIGAHRWCA